MDTLAFGYILPTTGRIRDFNPLETYAARRTNQNPEEFIILTGFFIAISFQKLPTDTLFAIKF